MGVLNVKWAGSAIKQDASNRLVTDDEKTAWANKADKDHTHTIDQVYFYDIQKYPTTKEKCTLSDMIFAHDAAEGKGLNTAFQKAIYIDTLNQSGTGITESLKIASNGTITRQIARNQSFTLTLPPVTGVLTTEDNVKMNTIEGGISDVYVKECILYDVDDDKYVLDGTFTTRSNSSNKKGITLYRDPDDTTPLASIIDSNNYKIDLNFDNLNLNSTLHIPGNKNGTFALTDDIAETITNWNNAIGNKHYMSKAGASHAPLSNAAFAGSAYISQKVVFQIAYLEDTDSTQIVKYSRKGIFNTDTSTFSWSIWAKETISLQTRTIENGSSFNALIPSTTTSIVFTDIKAPSSASIIDVDADGDGGVVAWMDNTTMYVSTQSSGEKVKANPSCGGLFNGKSNVINITTDNLDTSAVTIASNMFFNCSGLTTLDLSDWNVSNVEDMGRMFFSCRGLTTLDLSNWNVSSVKTMSGMFYGCSGLTSLDLSSWDVSNAENMSGMFGGCTGLTTLDLSNWNVSSVKDMSTMFYGCSGLTSLTLNWPIINPYAIQLTDMSNMFSGCSSLTTLELSDLNTTRVTDMSNMFYGCTKLRSLSLYETASEVTSMTSMFMNCKKLETISVPSTTSKLTKMDNMFTGCTYLETVDMRFCDTSGVTDMSNMFSGCTSLRYILASSKIKWIGTLADLGLNTAWKDESGTKYQISDAFPSNVAHTYTKVS